MKQKSQSILLYALMPRTILLFAALCNFVWYFPLSRVVKKFGSTAISFGGGVWYYESPHAGKPFLLLVAVLFMLFDCWWGYLITVVISGFLAIEGIIWVSRGKGLVGGIAERIELISTELDAKLWEFLDWQYLLALIVFITASGYLIARIAKIRQNIVNHY